MPSETSCKDLKREFCTLRDGRKLAFIVQAPREASASSLPHVFMLPGMCGTADDVLFQSPPEKYIWVCVDRPGYGDSSSPVDCETYSYHQFAMDIQELASRIQVTEFYVAGHSSGGPCALACAAHSGNDNRLKGVAAIAADAEYSAEGAPMEGPLEKCCIGCYLPCCLLGLSCGGTCGPMSKRLPGYKVDYRLEHEPYDFRIESITLPTLLAFGDDDTWARPHSLFIKKEIEGAELMVIPGVNHGTIIKKVHMDAIISKLLSMA